MSTDVASSRDHKGSHQCKRWESAPLMSSRPPAESGDEARHSAFLTPYQPAILALELRRPMASTSDGLSTLPQTSSVGERLPTSMFRPCTALGTPARLCPGPRAWAIVVASALAACGTDSTVRRA